METLTEKSASEKRAVTPIRQHKIGGTEFGRA